MFTRLCIVSNINWEVGVRERGDMHSKLAIIRVKVTEANHRGNGDRGGEGKRRGRTVEI